MCNSRTETKHPKWASHFLCRKHTWVRKWTKCWNTKKKRKKGTREITMAIHYCT